jgi:ATP-binding cassette subfamily C exporter for protease/lipase
MTTNAISPPRSEYGGFESGAGSPRWIRNRGPIAQLLWRFRREFVWVLVFSMFANVLMLVPTIYMLQLFDRVMLSGSGYTLITLTVLALGFAAAMAFAEWMRSWLMIRAGTQLDEALSRPVFLGAFTAQLRAPMRSPQQPLADLDTLRQFMTGNGMFAMADAPWAFLFMGVMFLMHPWLGALSLAFCGLQLVLALWARQASKRHQKRTLEAEMEQAAYLQTKLRHADTVAAMGMQQALRNHWLSRNETLNAAQADSRLVSSRVQVLMKWVQYTQQALMLSLGAVLAIKGEITAGAMVASNALMGNALRPFGLLVQVWPQAIEAKAAWQRLDDLLKRSGLPSADSPDHVRQAPKILGQVSVENLTVTVPGRSQPILSGVSAEFVAGETVAIVGPSGAGKSTLVRCLLGIWPEYAGKVSCDGRDVSALDRDEFGRQVGYLPQDIELFDGTVAENIGRFAEVDSAAVVRAAKQAGVHDMILRMPKGYDSPVGEGGALLSGGQRQRIALARALVNEPSIVVLDEPNANLDDAGEAALIGALRELRIRGATVFMIVHRHHLLKLADRMLLLDAGQVVTLAPLGAAATKNNERSKP